MGLEPIRPSTHAPQTCLSAYSSTLALTISEVFLLPHLTALILYQIFSGLSTPFLKFFQIFFDFF